MEKKSFTYKGLKKVREHLNASRNLTKKLEGDPNVTRDELVRAVGTIGDRKLSARKHIQTNDDWDKIQDFSDLQQRVIKRRRNLFKEASMCSKCCCMVQCTKPSPRVKNVMFVNSQTRLSSNRRRLLFQLLEKLSSY